MKRIPLEILESETQRLLKGRHQKNTRKAYEGEIEKYLNICKLYDWEFYPKPFSVETMEKQMALFLTYLCMEGDNGWSSLNSYVYAIKSFMLERYGINMGTTKEDMPIVKGIITKKKKDKPSVNTKHIDKMMLKKLFKKLKEGDISDASYRFMFACAHNTMRRPTEVLAANGDVTLVEHVSFQNGSRKPMKGDLYAILNLTKSKMNKFGEEQNVVMTCICPDICALCELRNLYAIRRKGGWLKKDPLLVVNVKGNLRIPTYDNWRNKLRWLVRECGIKGDGWTLHGCRGGGQEDARERGLSLHSIMQQAGWKSVKTAVLYDRKLNESKKAKRILEEQWRQGK